jgi:hypothetical protein
MRCNCLFREKSRWVFFLALPLILLPACVFEAGVGDPASAKLDKELSGAWVNEGDQLIVLTAKANKDGKTYSVEYRACKGTLDSPAEPQLGATGETWLAEIGGERFVTIKVASWRGKSASSATKPEKPYFVLKLRRTDDKLELTPLASEFQAFKTAKSREDMERAVKDNLQESSAYSSPLTFTRSTPEAVKKVAELFERE